MEQHVGRTVIATFFLQRWRSTPISDFTQHLFKGICFRHKHLLKPTQQLYEHGECKGNSPAAHLFGGHLLKHFACQPLPLQHPPGFNHSGVLRDVRGPA